MRGGVKHSPYKHDHNSSEGIKWAAG